MRPELRAALSDRLGERVERASTVGGGDINRAFRVQTKRRSVFVKVNDEAPLRMFECEERGLAALRDAHALRVPDVLGCGAVDHTTYLILEWIDSGPPSPGFARRFGESLAELHRRSSDAFGFEQDNFIGSLPQPNRTTETWLEFFSEQRLGAQLAIARRKGSLSAATLERADRLLDRLGSLLPERSEPSLLHGDLWGGNYMIDTDGEAVLIDPAVYFGDREIELAFTELFGGFGADFYDAYNASWPLPSEYAERRDLYNLYPLLVHANLFGGGYASRVDRIVRTFL